MRCVVGQAELIEALGWVVRAVPARPATPVLAGVRMHIDGGVLSLHAFDYEQTATSRVTSISDAEDGECLVPGRLFAEIVRVLPRGAIQIRQADTTVVLETGSSRFTLPQLALDAYPALPDLPGPLGTVDAAGFTDAVRQVVPAADRDGGFPVLTGVHMAFDPAAGTVRMAATDRFRLAARTVAFTPTADTDPVSVLVPARTLDGYVKTTGGAETLTVGYADGLFAMSTASRHAGTRPIEGTFPKYESLVPTSSAGQARVVAAELADAVRRVALVAASKIDPCRVILADDHLRVEAGDGSAAAASETVPADCEGEQLTVAFNPTFLGEACAAFGDGKVSVSLSPEKPALFQLLGQETGPDIYLVMPVRLA